METIVIVDDNPTNIAVIKHLIKRLPDCESISFEDSQEGLSWCQTHDFDMLIVDYMMPPPDGISFIKTLRALPAYEDVPILMITAAPENEVRYLALESGANDFLTKPIDKAEFIARSRNMLTLRRNQKLLSDRAKSLEEAIGHAVELVHRREREIIFRLSRAAEYRDPETGGHILRIAHYARLIAETLALPLDEQQLILDASPMHDVGKVATPDHILLKPGRLDPDELFIMQQHARIGYEILKDSHAELMQAAASIALSHHERFDGSGYPHKLAGTAIPLHGRIVAVADVFDALTSERPYKKAWDVDYTIAFMREQSGRHFDPECLDAFFSRLKQVLEIRARYADGNN